jgi:hypothetical protein
VAPCSWQPGWSTTSWGQLDVDVEPGRLRVDDGDARPLVLLDEAVAQQPGRLRQLHPVVDAHGLAGHLGDGRGDAAARRCGAGRRRR